MQWDIIFRLTNVRRPQDSQVFHLRCNGFLMPGIGLKVQRSEKRGAELLIGFLQQGSRNLIAFPKFKRELVRLGLIGNCAEQKAPITFQIVVLEEFPPAFEREIIRVDEIFVKGISL